jgi:hypothetical protein
MGGSDRGLMYGSLLSRHLSGGTEENHETLSQDSWSPGLNWKSGPPEFEAGVPTTRPRRSVYSPTYQLP